MCKIARPLVLGMSGALVSQAVAEDYRYAIFQIGLSTNNVGTRALDETGAAYGDAKFGVRHAFAWTPPDGPLIDMRSFGGQQYNSYAYDVNSLGWVVGTTLQGTRNIATLWKPNQGGGYDVSDLGNLGVNDAEANGVNDVGQIVGISDTPMSQWTQAFIWQDDVMTQLPSLADDTTSAKAINQLGTIVGFARDADSHARAAIWKDDDGDEAYSLEEFGPGTCWSVNDMDEMAGEYFFVGASDWHAFLRRSDGTLVDLHNDLLGFQSRAYGLNNQSQAVGICYYGNQGPDTAVAFVWTATEGMLDLNLLIPPLTGKELSGAHVINDSGQIAADGGDPNLFDAESYLLSPVFPSMTVKAIGHGGALVAGANNALRVTGATPGARITFLWSSKGGGEAIPGCDLQENALQLDSPTIIGTATANAQGVATLQRFVPAAAQGRTILLQAVAPSGCAISQLMLTTVR